MSKNTNLSFLTDYITADITNGRIGINTPSPAYAFDVTGVARTSTSTYLATASGNVGIGTSSPTRLLDVSAAGTAYIRTSDTTNSVNVDMLSASSGGWIGTQSNHSFQLQTNNTERMRITSGGNLLVGTTSDNGNKLQVSGGISASGNISGANIGGSSFSMSFGSTFNYGTGYLKSSTNGITVTTSTTTIFTSTNIGGVVSGNLVLVSGVRAGNGPTFTDLILYMNSGSISVISSQIFSTPPSRNYSVSNENLNLSMASGTYIVACVALIQGYTNP